MSSSPYAANEIFDDYSDNQTENTLDISGLRLGGYDAKIVSKKKCPTELAFNYIPDIATEVVEYSEFTQSLFSEGNHFEDALMDQINAVPSRLIILADFLVLVLYSCTYVYTYTCSSLTFLRFYNTTFLMRTLPMR